MKRDLFDAAVKDFVLQEEFGSDEQAMHDCRIALLNGFEKAQRCEEVLDELGEALAVLHPVDFPRPAPRTLRAVGFVLGCVAYQLPEMHRDEEFRKKLVVAVAESQRAIREWDGLSELFNELFLRAAE